VRVIRLVTAFALLSSLALAAPVGAATPTAGALSSKQRIVRWSGGPYYVSRPVGCHVPYLLLKDDPTCDSFFLQVNLRAGAKIEVHLAAARPAKSSDGPAPVSGDDYDVYVWDSSGLVLFAEGRRINEGVETVVFSHDPKRARGPYEIEVIPYLILPDSTYTARARVISR
jgi:hypothetical protein